MPGRGTIAIYMDGKCGFCQWSQAVMRKRDVHGRLEFRDYNDPTVAAEAPFTFEELDRGMHVRTPEGHWRAGFYAWLEIMNVMPRWRWLGSLFGLPPIRWFGPALYWMVASNRYRLSAPLLRLAGAPPRCDTQCRIALKP